MNLQPHMHSCLSCLELAWQCSSPSACMYDAAMSVEPCTDALTILQTLIRFQTRLAFQPSDLLMTMHAMHAGHLILASQRSMPQDSNNTNSSISFPWWVYVAVPLGTCAIMGGCIFCMSRCGKLYNMVKDWFIMGNPRVCDAPDNADAHQVPSDKVFCCPRSHLSLFSSLMPVKFPSAEPQQFSAGAQWRRCAAGCRTARRFP